MTSFHSTLEGKLSVISSFFLLLVGRTALAMATAVGGSGWHWKEEAPDLDYRNIMERLWLGLRWRSAFSPHAGRLQTVEESSSPSIQMLPSSWDSDGMRAGLTGTQGEREREMKRARDSLSHSIRPSLFSWWINAVCPGFLGGAVNAGERASPSILQSNEMYSKWVNISLHYCCCTQQIQLQFCGSVRTSRKMFPFLQKCIWKWFQWSQ